MRLQYLLDTWQVTPVGFEETPQGAVYVAEGKQSKRPNVETRDGIRTEVDYGEGWTLLWAVKHRGMWVAQPIYVDLNTPADDRRALALSAGKKFLSDWHGKQEGHA